MTAVPVTRRVLFLFLDGVGLGDNDPIANPFALANTPTLNALAGGYRWLRGVGRQETARALFIPTDPRLGVPGKPQRASGQAAIFTGRNVPQIIGEHYGPRPDARIRAVLDDDNLFKRVAARGGRVGLLEAYPPEWHEAVNSGKRLLSSYQYAPFSAGAPLFDVSHFRAGEAMTVDFTGMAWRERFGFTDTPLYSPRVAGEKLVELARGYTFSLFPNWWTDYVGHRGTLQDGVNLLELFDAVMAGVLASWLDDDGIIVITSDHGNMEDMTQTKHTENDVPTIIIGRDRGAFASIRALTDIAPAIERYLFGG